jgi:CBS domain-containing protein
MTCAEIMTPNPKMRIPENNISAAVDIMWDCDCGAVPVVKDMESKELVGIFTDRDIAIHIVKHANAHPSEVKVADCMSYPAVYVVLEDPVEKAAESMGENQIRRIPVVDENGSCVGIISQADLLSRLTGTEVWEAVYTILGLISVPHSKEAEEPGTSDPADKKTDAGRKKKAKDRVDQTAKGSS